MEGLIKRIKEVKENEVTRLGPNLIMWKEGPTLNVNIANGLFDELEDLLKDQKGKVYYLVDISLGNRPSPEMIQLFEKRLKSLGDPFKHVAMYTGQNNLMYLGIKVYLIRFAFPSYSAHKSLKDSLESFS